MYVNFLTVSRISFGVVLLRKMLILLLFLIHQDLIMDLYYKLFSSVMILLDFHFLAVPIIF